MINTKIASVILILAFSISFATADETRHHRFEATDVSSLVVNMRAGSIHVEHTEEDYIDAEVLISEEKTSWFQRSINTENMDLNVDNNDSELELSFDYQGVNTDWSIKIPALSKIEINAGAGTIEISMAHAHIDTTIGVGTIELKLPKALFGELELTSGVGDTSARGANSVESRRAFVSSDLRAQGDGRLTVRANAGVGSLDVDLI